MSTFEATYSPMTEDYAAVGHIRRIRVYGEGFSIGGGWWWERLPERIATAGLGEWELIRRQVSAYDPAVGGSTVASAPHYEQRHWHLHRNGRFDVVGRSPITEYAINNA